MGADERQEHNEISPWWGEHTHRYAEACKLLRSGMRVFDIACGNGYGTSMIAQTTQNLVTGGDISEDAVMACRRRYAGDSHLEFHVCDGTALTFADNTFDAVVSFETIEHTTRYREMIREFRRVLKPDGICIISTPNIVINSPGRKVMNPFHTQEFDYEELSEILQGIFPNIHIYGQEYIRYHQKGFGMSVGKMLEWLLYQRGIRKLPISIQDTIMRPFVGKGMYPETSDYRMTDEKSSLLLCKTFWAVCNK